jgi:threonine aldolase
MAGCAVGTNAVGVVVGPRAIVTVVTPPPPDQSFASDNAAGAHPQVIEALRAANAGAALPYGQDLWTTRSAERFRALFEADVEVFYTYGGTGANVVALQCLLAPHEAVICPSSAHINVDECGAPERFTGAKLIDIPSSDGKLSPDMVRALLQPSHDEHHVTPRVVAISQPTELGTVYTVDEIGDLARLAHEHGLVLYVDGARLANAVAALGCSVRELTYGAGVDVLTFGGTKNGLLYGEAVVFLRPELARRARFARKQAGQLASKMRFIAAQFDVLLEDDLWLVSAANANNMAGRLASRVAEVPHVEIVRPVEVNSLFARLPAPLADQLQNWSFFWNWDLNDNVVRWMTSFATRDEDVVRFAEGVRYFANQYGPGTSRS